VINLEQARQRLLAKCETAEELHKWLQIFLGIDVPMTSICASHDAPMEYLWRAYREPAEDLVVWASRGGGKTRLAAALTLLDLLHKPGVQVRILGGSLDQSHRMWDHLKQDIDRAIPQLVDARCSDRRHIQLTNGSRVGVLAQSQRAVRGLRVQKLRCDEVEMFDPRVWRAAQFVTRSETGVRGTIEAISTWHRPWGLMKDVLEKAREKKTRILHWCILDVLEKCPPSRSCHGCDLWDDCGGIAKTRCDGFFSIDDAIVIKRRSSLDSWQSEMLCRRPSTEGRVFPTFDENVHVIEGEPITGQISLAVDFGFHAPFICLWICTGADGRTEVVDEYVQSGRVMHEHIREIESRAAKWGSANIIACDPAGAAPNEQTAESNLTVLRRAGFHVRSRKSSIPEGIEMIRAGLLPAAGPTTLFVHRRCHRLIKALLGYHYPELGNSEKPVKDGDHDHLIDALRYHFVNRGASASGGRKY
jgi:hypothetical protein